MTQFDVVIIGAGIAGASIASEIGADRSVLLLEAEDHPGYHSTGRSAAFWTETYGG
ncbi:MAG: FAD-dependent oxidoreductase, partial [Parasphingorhabdus sp.]